MGVVRVGDGEKNTRHFCCACVPVIPHLISLEARQAFAQEPLSLPEEPEGPEWLG